MGSPAQPASIDLLSKHSDGDIDMDALLNTPIQSVTPQSEIDMLSDDDLIGDVPDELEAENDADPKTPNP